jgi:uncharacterized protein involved in response to NO
MKPTLIAATALPKTAVPQPGTPLFRLGFRPFYLGAAACAVVFMLLWQQVYTERLVLRSGLAPVLWHAHEMLFGVVCATIVGFLFTAGKTWTGLPTPQGAFLGALVALWLSGRIASLVAPYPVFFLLDLVFLPVAAALFLDLLVRAGNRRNLPIAAVLVLLAASNLLFHLAASGALTFAPVRALHAALGLIVILVSIIAGRVVPLFTMSVTPGLKLHASPTRDGVALALTACGLVMWVAGLWPLLSAVVLAMAAVLHLIRLLAWSPWVSRERPILWVLHVSYAWIPVGLALLATGQVGLLAPSVGIHALTVGAIGGMLIGMMTRTARGHTARPLKASKLEIASFLMIPLAAVARIAAPALPGRGYEAALVVAGALWIAAFTLYLIRFTPWLLMSRMDGKDG